MEMTSMTSFEPSSPKVAEIRSMYKKYAAEKRRIFELFHHRGSISEDARKFILEEMCDTDEILRLIEERIEKLNDGEKQEVDLLSVFWIEEGSDEWEEKWLEKEPFEFSNPDDYRWFYGK